MKKTTIISLMLVSFAADLATARDQYRGDDHHFTIAREYDRDDNRGCRGDRRCVSAPEVDPGQALGVLTLLGGAVAVLRGLRRRKKQPTDNAVSGSPQVASVLFFSRDPSW